MTPSSLPLPTDNIYKFACLFGLALMVSAFLGFVSMYSSSLDRKIKYSEAIIPLEAQVVRSKAEDKIIAMNKNLLEVAKSNETFSSSVIGVIFGAGACLAVYGWVRWHQVIQKRDDKLAQLQVDKLELEVAKLNAELNAKRPKQETWWRRRTDA